MAGVDKEQDLGRSLKIGRVGENIEDVAAVDAGYQRNDLPGNVFL